MALNAQYQPRGLRASQAQAVSAVPPTFWDRRGTALDNR